MVRLCNMYSFHILRKLNYFKMKKVLIALVLLMSPLFSNTSEATKNPTASLSVDCDIVCPICGSREVNHVHLNGSSTYYAKCRMCMHEWYGESTE